MIHFPPFTFIRNICDFFQFIAQDTWERIGFVRNDCGLKIFETTITQNILFNFAKLSKILPSDIYMFEAVNENRNGNDIEFFIELDDKFIFLPMQAKILWSNNKYTAMEHGPQICDLILYAHLTGGIPMYLLYNYYSDPNFIHVPNIFRYNFSKEQLGCSILDANYLLNWFAYNKPSKKTDIHRWTIPSFEDLHPDAAIPWYILACSCLGRPVTTLASVLPTVSDDLASQTKLYSFDEVISSPLWQRVNATSDATGNTEREIIQRKFYSKNTDYTESLAEEIGYRPRHRIILRNTLLGNF